MYLIPDEVDSKDPPIIVKRIHKIDISILGKRKNEEYVVMPDVDIDDVIAKNSNSRNLIKEKPRMGIIPN